MSKAVCGETVSDKPPRFGMALELSASLDASAPLSYSARRSPGPGAPFSEEQKQSFIASLAAFPSPVAACRAVGIGMSTAHKHRNKDPEFRAAWEEALKIGYDILESEAIRRATLGASKPVYYKGEVCGHVTEYSDSLLMFMLKHLKKDTYGDKAGDTEDKSLTIRVVGGLPPEEE